MPLESVRAWVQDSVDWEGGVPAADLILAGHSHADAEVVMVVSQATEAVMVAAAAVVMVCLLCQHKVAALDYSCQV